MFRPKVNVTQLRYREALEQIVAGCADPDEVAREALRHHRAENRTDLTGWRFTRLQVIFYAGMLLRSEGGKNLRKRSTWLCMCDCGNLAQVEGNSLLAGSTKSCGCLRSDQMARFLKHGKYSKRDVTLGLPEAGRPAKARILDCPPARLDAAG